MTKPPSVNLLFLQNTIRGVDTHNAVEIKAQSLAKRELQETIDERMAAGRAERGSRWVLSEDERTRQMWLQKKQEKCEAATGFITATSRLAAAQAAAASLEGFIDLTPYNDVHQDAGGRRKKRRRDGGGGDSDDNNNEEAGASGSGSGSETDSSEERARSKKERKRERKERREKKREKKDRREKKEQREKKERKDERERKRERKTVSRRGDASSSPSALRVEEESVAPAAARSATTLAPPAPPPVSSTATEKPPAKPARSLLMMALHNVRQNKA